MTNLSIIEKYSNFNIINRSSRPTKCPKCNSHVGFHKHSKYKRKKLCGFKEWIDNIFIQRFRCKACRKVVSHYPACLCSSRQAIPAVEALILKAKSNIENKLSLPFSSRTIWRWRKNWKSLAEHFSPDVIRFLLRDKPDISIYQSVVNRKTSWDYLIALFGEVYPSFDVTILMRLLIWFKRRSNWNVNPPQ